MKRRNVLPVFDDATLCPKCKRNAAKLLAIPDDGELLVKCDDCGKSLMPYHKFESMKSQAFMLGIL